MQQDDDRGATLLRVARNAIAQALGSGPLSNEHAGWLQQPGATFVTLTLNGALRGCIGSLRARRSLMEDVTGNAVAAALRDPRFAALTLPELDPVRIGVSMLSPLQPMSMRDEADALAQLQVGIDGLVFECQDRHSTFLPQVWEQLPAPQDFLGQLKVKAGFAPDFWSTEVRLHRYTVSKWEEEEADKTTSAPPPLGPMP